jgi:circadian clock protein KaiB
MSEKLLKLFVTGRTRRDREAVRNLRTIYTASELSKEFDLVVIDVLENPDQAEEDRILATPTLLLSSTHGSSRIIGDLSDSEEVLRLLGVEPGYERHSEGRDEQHR